MSKLQFAVFELEMDYAGHPYYISGNAILHALSSQLSYDEQRALRVSHGVFAPGSGGVEPNFPSEAFKGYEFGIGSKVPDIGTYQDLFLLRRAHQPWLPSSKPRDALNTHDMKVQGQDNRPILGRMEHITKQKKWYVHCYFHSPDESLIPIDEQLLDGLQLGGARNYGYGLTSLKDTKAVDLDDLDYSWIEDGDGHVLELVTPYVLTSEHPKTDDNDVPWWWDQSLNYRHRTEKIVEQGKFYELDTIDHGQVTRYEGDRPVETAKKGVQRLGTHSKYGFGELMVRPTSN